MIENLKLVVLDYPKYLVKDAVAMKVLSDLIKTKQENYERSEESFIALSPLDMVSTHFLIYNTEHIYNPELILAIRTTYEDRTKKHKLKLPCDEYFPYLSEEVRNKFTNYREKKKFIADCNGFFIDPKFSFNKTKIPLAEIGFMMVVLHALQRNFDHIIGATNVTFKSDRWIEPLGYFLNEQLLFKHPVLHHMHRLIMIESFKYDWLTECLTKFERLLDSMNILAPTQSQTGEILLSVEEIAAIALELTQTQMAS